MIPWVRIAFKAAIHLVGTNVTPKAEIPKEGNLLDHRLLEF
jgi:hypothetical protein